MMKLRQIFTVIAASALLLSLQIDASWADMPDLVEDGAVSSSGALACVQLGEWIWRTIGGVLTFIFEVFEVAAETCST